MLVFRYCIEVNSGEENAGVLEIMHNYQRMFKFEQYCGYLFYSADSEDVAGDIKVADDLRLVSTIVFEGADDYFIDLRI